MADPKPTKIEKALDFKAKYQSLMNEARDEAIASIHGQIETLKELGFTFELVEAGGRTSSRAARSGEKKQRTCKICGKTGHNARTCPQKPKA
ncbi:hypothetical protein [uncultured Paludibaculum sp.]|uniref:hypothetical protein n=1 Tax=uncultured Paludibaculum sp. TaxID=1765020 RepID=UPI002AABA567|nr:hypothetical protein [uncultured Paludibaculum sp.]